MMPTIKQVTIAMNNIAKLEARDARLVMRCIHAISTHSIISRRRMPYRSLGNKLAIYKPFRFIPHVVTQHRMSHGKPIEFQQPHGSIVECNLQHPFWNYDLQPDEWIYSIHPNDGKKYLGLHEILPQIGLPIHLRKQGDKVCTAYKARYGIQPPHIEVDGMRVRGYTGKDVDFLVSYFRENKP